MQTSSEIRSNIENLSFYSSEIQKLIEKQLDLDLKRGNEQGYNINSQSIRFDNLAAIHAACDWIKLYIQNIESNLKSCEAQDKILHKPEEVNQESLL